MVENGKKGKEKETKMRRILNGREDLHGYWTWASTWASEKKQQGCFYFKWQLTGDFFDPQSDQCSFLPQEGSKNRTKESGDIERMPSLPPSLSSQLRRPFSSPPPMQYSCFLAADAAGHSPLATGPYLNADSSFGTMSGRHGVRKSQLRPPNPLLAS
jgi:hypothetical protein